MSDGAGDGMRWGNWTFNKDVVALQYVDPESEMMIYEVPLDEQKRSAHVLDFIFQIAEKTWASDADVGNFVRAVAATIGRGMAAGGVDRQQDSKAILKSKFGVSYP